MQAIKGVSMFYARIFRINSDIIQVEWMCFALVLFTWSARQNVISVSARIYDKIVFRIFPVSFLENGLFSFLRMDFLLFISLSAYHFAWQCEFIGFYKWIQKRKENETEIYRSESYTQERWQKRAVGHETDTKFIMSIAQWIGQMKRRIRWNCRSLFGIQCSIVGRWFLTNKMLLLYLCAYVCCLQALSFLFSSIRLRFRCCHTDDSMHIVYLTFLHQQRYRHQFVFATLHRMEHNLWESLMEMYSKHIRFPTGYTFFPIRFARFSALSSFFWRFYSLFHPIDSVIKRTHFLRSCFSKILDWLLIHKEKNT